MTVLEQANTYRTVRTLFPKPRHFTFRSCPCRHPASLLEITLPSFLRFLFFAPSLDLLTCLLAFDLRVLLRVLPRTSSIHVATRCANSWTYCCVFHAYLKQASMVRYHTNQQGSCCPPSPSACRGVIVFLQCANDALYSLISWFPARSRAGGSRLPLLAPPLAIFSLQCHGVVCALCLPTHSHKPHASACTLFASSSCGCPMVTISVYS